MKLMNLFYLNMYYNGTILNIFRNLPIRYTMQNYFYSFKLPSINVLEYTVVYIKKNTYIVELYFFILFSSTHDLRGRIKTLSQQIPKERKTFDLD